MNILYIAPTDPRSTKNGGEQRTHFIWKALQQCGNVFSVVTLAKQPTADVTDDEAQKIHFTTVCKPRPMMRLLAMTVRKLRLGQVYVCNRNESLKAFRWGDVKFDRVVVRYAGWAWVWGAWRFGPLCIDIDDTPMTVFDTQLSQVLPFWARPISRFFYFCWQKRLLQKAACGWVPNSDDIKAVSQFLKVSHLRNLANEVPENYHFHGRQEKLVLTVGFMGYSPNSTGVSWYVKEVWPTIYASHPDWIYAIAGGEAPRECVKEWSKVPGVRVLGFVDDIEPLYEKAGVVVAPILTGTGTCIKVLESCLRGRKTFVTDCAARGYRNQADGGLSLGVFNSADEFKKAFEEWIEQTEAEQKIAQEKIRQSAAALNSFSEFSNVVAKSIKEMC